MLLYIGSACLLTSIACLTPPVTRRLQRWLRNEEQRFHEILTELFLFDVSPRTLSYLSLAIIIILGLIVYGLTGGHWLGALAGAGFGYALPRIIISQMRRRRRDKLDKQLIDGLVTLANGLRAGLNLVQSIRLVAEHLPRPISDEFSLMLREFDHGISVEEVLTRASRRIKLHNYELLFTALETARRRGGNLAETLDRLGESLREVMRLEEKVRAVTSEGRTSAWGMRLTLPAIVGVYYLIDPEGLAMLFSGYGWYILLAVVILNVIAFTWIRKIVHFEI